ncbi:MAG: hypothetical protein R3B47_20825 [Bacteroidia bacterium]
MRWLCGHGVGFIDDSSEVLQSLVDSMPDAPAPNQLYENSCIKAYNLAADIDSMDLRRPALGPFTGTLNLPLALPYTIRGVGNIYGGAFNNYFASADSSVPVLYFFHRPCDLIVPYNRSRTCWARKLRTGLSCLLWQYYQPPGSSWLKGIKDPIDTLHAGAHAPRYTFDVSTDQFNRLQQVSTPCHAVDNFWLRSNNIASFLRTRSSHVSILAVTVPRFIRPFSPIHAKNCSGYVFPNRQRTLSW